MSALLSPSGLRLLSGEREVAAEFADRSFILLRDVIDRRTAASCQALLEGALAPHLHTEAAGIDPRTVSSMKERYTERLHKTMRVRTAFLEKRGSRAFRAAVGIRLVRMLLSDGLRRFAEAVTGFRLAKPPSIQVTCYQHGDYVGPHNDHHPDNPDLRDGFVDVHIMFSNAFVAHQYLVYERRGHLSEIVDISGPASVAVYHLPFWHYTTPLVGKRSHEAQARRWLLLASFCIMRP